MPDYPVAYVAGDVAYHYNMKFNRHIRLEFVPNATEQANTIASHINGLAKPHRSLVWVWSYQFSLKLQIAGLSEGYDSVIIRIDIKTNLSFGVFYFKEDQIIAASNSAPKPSVTVILIVLLCVFVAIF